MKSGGDKSCILLVTYMIFITCYKLVLRVLVSEKVH